MNTEKQFAAPEDIVKSVLALRAELAAHYAAHHLSILTAEMLAKINSCLYSKYPHK
jgi:hypothetical protein